MLLHNPLNVFRMFPISKFHGIDTPFYYYDLNLLVQTLDALKQAIAEYDNFSVHYALKANNNLELLKIISKAGFGADCVSGGEIELALNAGFDPLKIVFAGVGKSDREIILGLENNIFCFNVESFEELEIIENIAKSHKKIAPICLRVNPNVDAHTHANITTGLSENKFGIPFERIEQVIEYAVQSPCLNFFGLHFHIGSQITDMSVFKTLCLKINDLQESLSLKNISIQHLNVGGGLGINYENPVEEQIPNFRNYFKTYAENLQIHEGQKIHFELGRSIVAQSGSLIARVLYIKKGVNKEFMILDASMTELIRPALYDANHVMQNISAEEQRISITSTYDVVGPVCESSDVFGENVVLQDSKRGDLIAIRSAGAYGEVMASQYNCRPLPPSIYSEIE